MGFSPRTGSPSTSVSFDSATSNSPFAFAAASSADTIPFLRDNISFLRSEIRLYVLLTVFLRTCRWEKEKVRSTRRVLNSYLYKKENQVTKNILFFLGGWWGGFI